MKYLLEIMSTMKNVESLKDKITQVNSLDKDGLKSLYKDVIKGGELSSKGGAGLGFIDMARKKWQQT